MFDHVTIRASDVAASEAFFRTVLPAVGIERPTQFSLVRADDPALVTRHLHIAFAAASRDVVDEFWRVGTAAGYRDDGAPGPRPQYGPEYYGGFLLDPDGNSVEAIHNDWEQPPLEIDHLWIRVSDLAAARAFYEPVGARAGFGVGWRNAGPPPRVGFKGDVAGTFSLVDDGEPTINTRIAFAGDPLEFALDPDGNEVGVVGSVA